MQSEVFPVSEVLPPREWSKELKAFSVRLPVDLAAEVEAAAKESGYSINEAMIYLTSWALKQHRAEKAARDAERAPAPKKK